MELDYWIANKIKFAVDEYVRDFGLGDIASVYAYDKEDSDDYNYVLIVQYFNSSKCSDSDIITFGELILNLGKLVVMLNTLHIEPSFAKADRSMTGAGLHYTGDINKLEEIYAKIVDLLKKEDIRGLKRLLQSCAEKSED